MDAKLGKLTITSIGELKVDINYKTPITELNLKGISVSEDALKALLKDSTYMVENCSGLASLRSEDNRFTTDFQITDSEGNLSISTKYLAPNDEEILSFLGETDFEDLKGFVSSVTTIIAALITK